MKNENGNKNKEMTMATASAPPHTRRMAGGRFAQHRCAAGSAPLNLQKRAAAADFAAARLEPSPAVRRVCGGAAVLRYALFCPVLLCLLTFLLTSCCVRDLYHDWRYGDNPVPTTGIAPSATPVPGEFTEAEAVAYVTDDLIFFLSTVSAAGLPSVICGQDALAQAVCIELLRSRVIEHRFGGVDYSLKAEKKDGKYLVALYSRQGKCEYSRSLKLKGETAQK